MIRIGIRRVLRHLYDVANFTRVTPRSTDLLASRAVVLGLSFGRSNTASLQSSASIPRVIYTYIEISHYLSLPLTY